MSKRFDLSKHPGTSQRLVFAVFGFGQLVLSSVAFHRGGFFYGLVVLICGIAAFCTAVFFVHRLNLRLVWLGPEGIIIAEGLRGRQTVAWQEIDVVRLTSDSTVFHLKTGTALALHSTGRPWPDLVSFLNELRVQTTAHQIPVEGQV